MKMRTLFSGLLAGLFLFPAAIFAQDSPAAETAAREEFEANYRRMNTKIEQLEETLQAQQKNYRRLIDEIHSLQQQVETLKSRNESAATRESIKELAEKIEEVDKKRLADNKLIVERVDAIAKGITKSLAKPVPAPVPDTPKPDKPDKGTPPNGSAPPEKAYEYRIKDGDTLGKIVSGLKAENYKVTQKQIMDVNPGVNWSKLKIGQKIYIPPSMP
jgi:LysM repeat protein